MKETLGNKIDAMQKRMQTNAAGARKRAYDASALKRASPPTATRDKAAPADAAKPATDAARKP